MLCVVRRSGSSSSCWWLVLLLLSCFAARLAAVFDRLNDESLMQLNRALSPLERNRLMTLCKVHKRSVPNKAPPVFTGFLSGARYGGKRLSGRLARLREWNDSCNNSVSGNKL